MRGRGCINWEEETAGRARRLNEENGKLSLQSVWFILGLSLLMLTLLDGFETILVPRRIQRKFRFSRLYYRSGWAIWQT